ncbi:MAG: alpha/beta hydrolase [Gammaproteobacteria bacterium]|nr:alpha/beta hydrolase [Gammaproteobacteria bacterium]
MRPLLRLMLRYIARPVLGPPLPARWQRIGINLLMAGMPTARGVRREILVCGAARVERQTPQRVRDDTVILYAHGGAFLVGSPATHRGLTTRLARSAKASLYSLDYRLAPEHPYPAALQDARSAYEFLLSETTSDRRIVLAGDSAGAGLMLALAVCLREAQRPMPDALVMISPWVDYALSGRSLRERARIDPLLREAWVRQGVAAYAGDYDAAALSPLAMSLGGLPRCLIQVGSDEILLDDARRLDQRLREAGVPSTLREYPGLWHEFQLHAGLMRESNAAINEIADFLHAAPVIPDKS